MGDDPALGVADVATNLFALIARSVMTAKVYRSKIDAWLLIAFIVSMSATLGVSVFMLMNAAPGAIAFVSIITILGAGLPLWICLGTRYVLTQEALAIRCGPFRWRVPIAGITDISRTRNPLSSPALSLDRLRIDYGAGSQVMISPKDMNEFLAQMERLRAGVAFATAPGPGSS